MKTKTSEEPTLFDVDDDAGSVELISASEATAALRAPGRPAEPLMMSLARIEDGLQVLDRAHLALRMIRANAIRLTGHADWVATKARGAPDDEAVCMLVASGAAKIAPFFGISCEPAQPTDTNGAFRPQIERGEGSEIQLHGWAIARCNLTGETIRVSGSRASSEDFTGRSVAIGATELVAKADLTRSLETLLRTKAVRELAGMKKVPVQELADAGIKVAQIPRGSGFGSSADRSASAVVEPGIAEARDKLRDEILRRVGGDKQAARDLLKDCTANPGKFAGFSSIDRIAQGWQVENAWKRLRAHEVFGDKEQEGGQE